MTAIALPGPPRVELPRVVLPSYEELGERLRLPRWARPWERTKEDAYVSAIGLAQQQQATVGAGSVASLDFVLGAAPTNGNMLVCALGCNDDATGPTMAGTGVTWTRQNYFVGDGNHDNIAFWTGMVGSGAAATQTSTFHLNSNNCAGIMAEFSGVQQAIDGTPPTPTDVSSATPSVTSNTPTVAGDLAVAFCEQASAVAPTGTPSTWTTLTAASNTRRIDGAWLDLGGSSSAVTPQWTFATSKFALLEVVLVKAASGGGGRTVKQVIVSREAQRRRW